MKREMPKIETRWVSDDISFCGNECDDIDCYRNRKNIRYLNIPHSFSMFRGTKFCPSYYKKKIE